MPEVCVVVPCFNEEHRLRTGDFVAFLDAYPDASLCFVDDGSGDRTFEVLEQLAAARPDRVFLKRMPSNRGKAEAVRAGVQHVAALGRWPFIGFWDADLSTPLDEVERLLTVLRSTPDCQLAMGSRVKRLGSHIDRHASRHILGRVFATAAVWTLGVAVYDSQCGAKVFRAAQVGVLFDEPFLTRWLFDLELLVRLRNRLGPAVVDQVFEVPLARWREIGGSKLKLNEMISVPLELFRIRSHYNKRS